MEFVLTIIEAYACMEEQLAIHLEIEEALQTEIKETLEHKIIHMLTGFLCQTREKIRTRLKLPLHMI